MLDPKSVIVKEPVGVILGVVADGIDAPILCIFIGAQQLAKSLCVYPLPFAEVVDGTDFGGEVERFPVGRLFFTAKGLRLAFCQS